MQHLDDPLLSDSKILTKAATWSLARLTESLGYPSSLQLVYIVSADLIISSDYSLSDDVVDMQFLVAPCHQPAPQPCSVLQSDLRAFRIRVSANDVSSGLLAVYELKSLAATIIATKSSKFFVPLYIPPPLPPATDDDGSDAIGDTAASSHKLTFLVPVVVSVSLVIVVGLLLVVYAVWARGKYQQQQLQDQERRRLEAINMAASDFPLHYQNRSRQEYYAPRIDSALAGASIDIEAARFVITSILSDKHSSRESSGISVSSAATFMASPNPCEEDEEGDEGIVSVGGLSRSHTTIPIPIQVAPAAEVLPDTPASDAIVNESEA